MVQGRSTNMEKRSDNGSPPNYRYIPSPKCPGAPRRFSANACGKAPRRLRFRQRTEKIPYAPVRKDGEPVENTDAPVSAFVL